MFGIAKKGEIMAYNNGFPMSYQPMYYQPQPQTIPQPQPVMPQTQPQPMSQGNSSIIWVQGEAGAKSYLVAPNNTVQLWDSETQTIYLKSADASGMPSMKVLDYKIRNSEQPTPQLSQATDNYVTLSEFNGLKDELARVKNELAKLSNREVNHDESKRDE